MSKTPVRVAVTGAAGQIGYSLLFRIAAGDRRQRNILNYGPSVSLLIFGATILTPAKRARAALAD